MAKKYDNDKGFLVIEMNYDEATILCNFGCQTAVLPLGISLQARSSPISSALIMRELQTKTI